jgi:hypothetical protein
MMLDFLNFSIKSDAIFHTKNKLHKYTLRKKSDEKIFDEISNGLANIYQQIKNKFSSLALAILQENENVARKLLEIYANDHKVLVENGYNNETGLCL